MMRQRVGAVGCQQSSAARTAQAPTPRRLTRRRRRGEDIAAWWRERGHSRHPRVDEPGPLRRLGANTPLAPHPPRPNRPLGGGVRGRHPCMAPTGPQSLAPRAAPPPGPCGLGDATTCAGLPRPLHPPPGRPPGGPAPGLRPRAVPASVPPLAHLAGRASQGRADFGRAPAPRAARGDVPQPVRPAQRAAPGGGPGVCTPALRHQPAPALPPPGAPAPPGPPGTALPGRLRPRPASPTEAAATRRRPAAPAGSRPPAAVGAVAPPPALPSGCVPHGPVVPRVDGHAAHDAMASRGLGGERSTAAAPRYGSATALARSSAYPLPRAARSSSTRPPWLRERQGGPGGRLGCGPTALRKLGAGRS
jgi:neural Wiskott-Aldrich syndrome protein